MVTKTAAKSTQAKYDLKARHHATTMSQAYLTATIRQCERAKNDAQNSFRVAYKQCQYCYYLRSSVVGRAFTKFICVACRKACQHPDTGVPVLCPKCSDKYRACSRCGGARDLSVTGDWRDNLEMPAPSAAQAKKIAKYNAQQVKLLEQPKTSRKAKRNVAS